MAYFYKTDFRLSAEVADMNDAREYLTRFDMTDFLLGDARGCYKVAHVEWLLMEVDYGVVVVETTEPLTESEAANISDWISGQCSDGLGEGFEQQDFANGGSFDWEINDYSLKLF